MNAIQLDIRITALTKNSIIVIVNTLIITRYQNYSHLHHRHQSHHRYHQQSHLVKTPLLHVIKTMSVNAISLYHNYIPTYPSCFVFRGSIQR